MAVSDPNQLCPKWGPLNKYDLLDYIDYYKSSKRRAPRWYHHPNILNLPKNTMEMNLFPIVYSHWIGWKEHLQENGIFHGNIHWYIWPKSDPKIQLVSIDIFNIHGYIDKKLIFPLFSSYRPKEEPRFRPFRPQESPQESQEEVETLKEIHKSWFHVGNPLPQRTPIGDDSYIFIPHTHT